MEEKSGTIAQSRSHALPGSHGLLLWWRAARRTNNKGQTAVIFIVLIALSLVLAAFTMNLGEVARLKTATANAADAGALAAASWVASGENRMAAIAESMWGLHNFVQLLFIIPFCLQAIAWLFAMFAALLWMESDLKDAGEEAMKQAWNAAQASALFTALQNAGIDDPSGDVNATQIKPISDAFNANNDAPPGPHHEFRWDRTGGDGITRTSTLTVDTAFQASPGWNGTWGMLMAVIMSPPIYVCSWTMIPAYIAAIGGFILPIPLPAGCATCFPIIIVLIDPFLPGSWSNGTGTITVTVKNQRSGGARVGFWTMRYPTISSRAVAQYDPHGTELETPTIFGFSDISWIMLNGFRRGTGALKARGDLVSTQ